MAYFNNHTKQVKHQFNAFQLVQAKPKIKAFTKVALYVLFVVNIDDDGDATDTGFFSLDDNKIVHTLLHLDKDVHNAMSVNLHESAILRNYILAVAPNASVTFVPQPPRPKEYQARVRFNQMRGMLEGFAEKTQDA